MEEQLISFETAALAKEKGFDIDCKLFYSTKDRPPMAYNISAKESLSDNPQYNKYILAPTQSLLQKWLREVHSIYVSSDYYQGYPEVRFYYDIKILSDDTYNGNQDSDDDIYTFEEAFELGLQQALKLIP